MVKPVEKGYVRVEAPFLDKISWVGIIKVLELDRYDTLKVGFERKKHT